MLDLSDKTGNSNSLTSNGASEYTTDSPYSTITEAVQFVRASSQYFSAPNIPALNMTDISLECWIKITSIPSNAWLIAKDDDVLGRAFSFGFNPTGHLDIQINGLSSSPIPPTVLSTGTWTHVAVTWNDAGQTITYYINGVADGTASPVSTGHIPITKAELDLGRRSFSTAHDYYNGIIAETRIWNVTRTAAQIKSNYKNLLTGNESGLVAYYPFQPLSFIFPFSVPGVAIQIINEMVAY